MSVALTNLTDLPNLSRYLDTPDWPTAVHHAVIEYGYSTMPMRQCMTRCSMFWRVPIRYFLHFTDHHRVVVWLNRDTTCPAPWTAAERQGLYVWDLQGRADLALSPDRPKLTHGWLRELELMCRARVSGVISDNYRTLAKWKRRQRDQQRKLLVELSHVLAECHD